MDEDRFGLFLSDVNVSKSSTCQSYILCFFFFRRECEPIHRLALSHLMKFIQSRTFLSTMYTREMVILLLIPIVWIMPDPPQEAGALIEVIGCISTSSTLIFNSNKYIHVQQI